MSDSPMTITTKACALRRHGVITVHSWMEIGGQFPVAFVYKYRTEANDFDKHEPPFLTPEFAQKLNKMAGTKTARIDEWLGYDYIKMDFEESSVEKCYALCEAALRLGAGIRPHNMMVRFNINPPDLPLGENLTPERVELIAVERMREMVNFVDSCTKAGSFGALNSALAMDNSRYPSAWITPQARTFIKEAIEKRWLNPDTKNEAYEKAQLQYDKECQVERGAVTSTASHVSTPLVPHQIDLEKAKRELEEEKRKWEVARKELEETKRKFEDKMQEEEEDNRQCLVCLNAAADTIVSPCMHCCVCEPCSERLRATRLNEASTRCMQCRAPIEAIFGPNYVHSVSKSNI